MKENKECYPYQQFHENRKKKKFHVFYVYVTLYIGVTLLYL